MLAGRRALVTGGANGLGAGIVRRLAAAGADGVVLDLPGALQADLPASWTGIGVDLRDDAATADAFAAIGELDVVVGSAGIVPGWAGIADLDLDAWDEVFRVNVRGVISTIRHAQRRMPRGGAIVAVGSLNSWRGDRNLTSYVASKHAVLGIVRSAALDLGPRGIRVNAVAPGPVATEALLARVASREAELGIGAETALSMMAGQTALRRIATVEDVAEATLFLASDMAAGITGQLLPVDCGIA